MSETTVGPEDTTVSVSTGSELVVRLPEIATTGYQWRVSLIDSPALVVTSDRPLPAGTATPGAAGMHEFRLRADAAGMVRVNFELSRPWEAVPEQRHTLTVTVT